MCLLWRGCYYKEILVVVVFWTNVLTATTVPPRTTTPPGGCFYDGKYYADGETISEDIYKCYGAFCQYGSRILWDDKCHFEKPPCNGWTEMVVGQCCPVCHTTTPTTITPSTTTPHATPPGGCIHEGKVYANGENIDRDELYHCYGTMCADGQVISWDEACFFTTPPCYGRSEKVLGQCCPVCHDNVTTTTNRPQISCLINGSVVPDGHSVSEDPNNCSSSVCSHGVVISYTTQCFYPENLCNGTWETVPGECCKVCVPNVTVDEICTMGNKTFAEGTKTIDETAHPCKSCQCMPDGAWSCDSVVCPEMLLCDYSYRLPGECCYTCAGTTLAMNVAVSFILTSLSTFKWTGLT